MPLGTVVFAPYATAGAAFRNHVLPSAVVLPLRSALARVETVRAHLLRRRLLFARPESQAAHSSGSW